LAHAEEVKKMRENSITAQMQDAILKKLNIPADAAVAGTAVVGTVSVDPAVFEALKKETEETKASL
jgi:hypothetical protein